MKSTAIITVALIFLAANPAFTQAPPPAPNGQILPPPSLDQLLGPIALYPDPLIAQILPAATQPSQIVLADNYLTQGGDPNAIDQQSWDSSVKALARYPDVLHYLDSNLQWTVQLGQAFLNQPSDVMDSIQRLRGQAQSFGNLPSNPQETVETDDGDIDIEPTNPDELYVPSYDAGAIYYEPGCGIAFGAGFPIGLWLDHDFDWHDHRFFGFDHDHPQSADWWHRPAAERRDFGNRAPAWQPGPRVVGRAPVINRGDRGYAPSNFHPVESAPREARAAPNPVQVHTIPARPTVGAFENVGNAGATRAASSRGAVSRGFSGGGGGGGRRR
jgi:hypothetical protein